jgi:hypothetical protein
MLLDNQNPFPHWGMMNHSWRISARQFLQIAIVLSLMFSGNVLSHVSKLHSGVSMADEMNHVDDHANSLVSTIDLSDIDTNSEHPGHSKHLKTQSDDTGSCSQVSCVAFYLEEFTQLENFSIRDTHLLDIGRAIFSNRLELPHRPPNA